MLGDIGKCIPLLIDNGPPPRRADGFIQEQYQVMYFYGDWGMARQRFDQGRHFVLNSLPESERNDARNTSQAVEAERVIPAPIASPWEWWR